MRVLITGATGLIGQEIVKCCHENKIGVNFLTTSKSKISQSENYKGFYWDTKSKEVDTKCFDGVEAIIHLAGVSIAKRWTSSYKKEIISSRVESTQLLMDSLNNTKNHNVTQVISASAVGIYPDSQVRYYETYNKEVNNSFLGHVVEVWENAVDDFSNLNIKVSKIRIGLVLSNKGGALKEIIKPINLGVGAAFGSGKQWQSWIHIKDLARMFVFVLSNNLEGVYNGVAPNPVVNQELTKMTAKVLDKPLFMPNIPKFLMNLVLGEMHIILFESQRVSSKIIESKGFKYKYIYLEPALRALLN